MLKNFLNSIIKKDGFILETSVPLMVLNHLFSLSLNVILLPLSRSVSNSDTHHPSFSVKL